MAHLWYVTAHNLYIYFYKLAITSRNISIITTLNQFYIIFFISSLSFQSQIHGIAFKNDLQSTFMYIGVKKRNVSKEWKISFINRWFLKQYVTWHVKQVCWMLGNKYIVDTLYVYIVLDLIIHIHFYKIWPLLRLLNNLKPIHNLLV